MRSASAVFAAADAGIGARAGSARLSARMPERAPASFAGLAGVLVVWGIAVALVGTSGEFPLSDDWAYAHVVRSLCEGRGFDLLPWTGASLVVQALYGAGACKVAGFSHELLRATTLVLSAIGIAAFYALLRALGAGRNACTAGAALLALSPLWFNLSFTFMTDVPFAALAITAAWLYVRALSDGTNGNGSRGDGLHGDGSHSDDRHARTGLLLAGAVAAAAFLVRQHALSIAVAAAAALLWPRRSASGDAASPIGARVIDAAFALALPVAAAAAYFLWAATAADVPLALHNKLGEAVTTSPLAILDAAFRAVATLGFLFTPWALTMRMEEGSERRAFVAALGLLGAAALFLFVREGALMFYLTNVLGGLRVGAVTTRDVLFLSQPEQPLAAGTLAARALVTAASLASAAALLARVGVTLPRLVTTGARPALFCVFALVLSGLGTLAQAHYYFDRYLLVLLPLAVASVVAVSPPPRVSWAAGAALAALGVYAVAGTHDYMQWNRARWQLLAILESAGVTAKQVDGGVEYNAERLAALLRTAPNDAQARSGQAATAKSWWWVADDEWIVAFRPLDGYALVDSRTYTRWLPPGEERVLVLRREGWKKCGDRSEHGSGDCAPPRDSDPTAKDER